jgi:hypothetical protein
MTYWVSQSSIWVMPGDRVDERGLRVLLERAAASIRDGRDNSQFAEFARHGRDDDH